ncbi:universal stress protein [Plantactinospora sp. WMMB334]|uniref:universal stress protein n=1 Tax=Plantactinospora sp. WMMB334 TaxID=3404119 RepID=UPI003B931609
MRTYRIVVGLDGSPGARAALEWAVRLAARRAGTVLVVTAWPDPARAVSRRLGGLRAERLALTRMQRARIAVALAGLRHPPRVLRMLVLADPVTALCHAAATADLVVLGAPGSGGRRHDDLVGPRVLSRLARRSARGAPVPSLVIGAGRAVTDGIRLARPGNHGAALPSRPDPTGRSANTGGLRPAGDRACRAAPARR